MLAPFSTTFSTISFFLVSQAKLSFFTYGKWPAVPKFPARMLYCRTLKSGNLKSPSYFASVKDPAWRITWSYCAHRFAQADDWRFDRPELPRYGKGCQWQSSRKRYMRRCILCRHVSAPRILDFLIASGGETPMMVLPSFYLPPAWDPRPAQIKITSFFFYLFFFFFFFFLLLLFFL